jgi:branched-chain amino acid transport system substrate-binding protein
MFVTPFFSRSRRAEVVEFMRAYEARFGARPDILRAQSYDAAKLLLNALESADISNEEGFAGALKQLEATPGVTGELKVTPSGEIIRRMSVVEVGQGEAVEIFVGGVPTGEIARSGTVNEPAQEDHSAEGAD